MSGSDIKQVTLALNHPDELNPRRRRRTRKIKDDVESQAVEDSTGSNLVGETVKIQKEQPIQAVPAVIPNPPAGLKPTTPGLGAGAIHIREKKNTNDASHTGKPQTDKVNAPTAPPTSQAPKVLPHKKRISNAPAAQTLKKQKFVVAAPPKSTPLSAPENSTITGSGGVGGKDLKQLKGVDKTAKRRFTERNIKIEVNHMVKTRKSRKVLKEQINKMHVQAIRRLLLKKGILKPKATSPPEPMMRSMLYDYYSLKQN